jgi:hypothetical protein
MRVTSACCSCRSSTLAAWLALNRTTRSSACRKQGVIEVSWRPSADGWSRFRVAMTGLGFTSIRLVIVQSLPSSFQRRIDLLSTQR